MDDMALLSNPGEARDPVDTDRLIWDPEYRDAEQARLDRRKMNRRSAPRAGRSPGRRCTDRSDRPE